MARSPKREAKGFSLSPSAARDVDEIAAHIAADSRKRAADFVDALEAKFRLAGKRPLAFPLRPEFGVGIRLIVHGAYNVFYRALDHEARIERVLHAARRLRRIPKD
jgi:toxin ParE1/3/4